ncbi:MAG: DNA polymerase III subunit delta' [Synechococcaceae cyanobacterium RL_1_2]|nr:DNA polymerase III subunit delta' [Synechococcaceae cyanobacterium RL_1_2]
MTEPLHNLNLAQGFETVIGQTQAVDLLTQAIARDRLAPAYLFVGAEGVGRSLTARCFTKILMAHSPKIDHGNHPDLLWVSPTFLYQGKLYTAQEAEEANLKRKSAPQIRMEQVRQIITFLQKPPLEAPRSIVVVEGAETMAEQPANALLKTLEEPGRATIILLAPSTDGVIPTIVSRCQKIPFHRLGAAELIQVLQTHGYGSILDDRVILAIAQGSPGLAIDCDQQLQALPPDLLPQLTTRQFRPLQALKLAQTITKTLDTNTQLWLVDYLQHWYWEHQRDPQLIQRWDQAKQQLSRYVQPRLVWECLLLRMG